MAANGITRRQQKALTAILSTPTLLEASRVSGIPYRTLHRWVTEDAAFKKALSEAESLVFGEALRRLLSLQGQAIDNLAATLRDPLARRTEQLRAVEVILGHVIKLRSATEIAERLEDLEAKVKELTLSLPQDHQSE